MPDSTTEIKGPTTEAGRRLLRVPWAQGEQAGLDLRDDIADIERQAAAAERAAIRAAVDRIIEQEPIGLSDGDWIDSEKLIRFLDSRSHP